MVAEDDTANPVRAASSTACQTIVLRNINKARYNLSLFLKYHLISLVTSKLSHGNQQFKSQLLGNYKQSCSPTILYQSQAAGAILSKHFLHPVTGQLW